MSVRQLLLPSLLLSSPFRLSLSSPFPSPPSLPLSLPSARPACLKDLPKRAFPCLFCPWPFLVLISSPPSLAPPSCALVSDIAGHLGLGGDLHTSRRDLSPRPGFSARA